MTTPLLPDISFADTDPATIEANIVAAYENAAGRTLAPADPVRLFLGTIAAVIVQQRYLIDYAAKQNLLAYAAGSFLDGVADLFSMTRLGAQAASATVAFTLSAAQAFDVTVPAGTRVTPDGTLYFATDTALVIDAGDTSGSVSATCTTTGASGNGYVAGQINGFVDPVEYVATAANLTTSAGGADAETDEALRARVRLAPSAFSVAGPIDAYIFHALSAYPGIADVTVVSPDPGEVVVYPLMSNGALPGAEVLTAIETALNSRTVRPLTDQVTAAAPTSVPFDVTLTYYIDSARSTEAAAIQAAVTSAVDGYVAWQIAALGRDLNPSELTARVMAAGAKRVVITDPEYIELDPDEVAALDDLTFTYGGLEDA